MPNDLLVPEQFKRALPVRMHKAVSQKLMDQINTTISDPVILESFRENLLGLSSVLAQGKFKMASYICAIKYVSYRLMGTGITDSYLNTFPGKHKDFVTRQVPAKTISSYASAYNKTKLVYLLLEQTLVPTHILNAPLFQAALNVQAALMIDSNVSPKVRSDAANSLLTHLKQPETQKIELDIGLKEDDSIKQLRQTTLALARQQQAMIESGDASVGGIAGSKLVPVERDVEEAEIV